MIPGSGLAAIVRHGSHHLGPNPIPAGRPRPDPGG
jgi:hypothetical protein